MNIYKYLNIVVGIFVQKFYKKNLKRIHIYVIILITNNLIITYLINGIKLFYLDKIK